MAKVNIFTVFFLHLLGVLVPQESVTQDYSSELKDVVVILISQPTPYHVRKAKQFVADIEEQTSKTTDFEGAPIVHLLHEKWPHPGAWTIFPIIHDLADYYADLSWIFICEEDTRIHLRKLAQLLKTYDQSKEWFIGKPLTDQEPTIIHHFAFHQDIHGFKYPDTAAGMLLSVPLLKKLSQRLKLRPLESDFSIDFKHELAVYIYDEGRGLRLTTEESLCTFPNASNCATEHTLTFPQCGQPLSEDDIFIAVKTCEKFHQERVVGVIQKTWEKDARHVVYYSEKEDPEIPTVSLGVPNTERGHCGKMMAILQRAYEDPEISKHKWIIIVDDDTILSVPRLRKLLACYDSDDAVVIGERYGYGLSASFGYNYPTGGAGMVLSRLAVTQLMDSELCSCSSIDSPDDMTLGMCLRRLAIPIVHSPYFHQARPYDYSLGYLSNYLPVSFHKHWILDPYIIYKDYLVDKDDSTESHDEL